MPISSGVGRGGTRVPKHGWFLYKNMNMIVYVKCFSILFFSRKPLIIRSGAVGSYVHAQLLSPSPNALICAPAAGISIVLGKTAGRQTAFLFDFFGEEWTNFYLGRQTVLECNGGLKSYICWNRCLSMFGISSSCIWDHGRVAKKPLAWTWVVVISGTQFITYIELWSSQLSW